MSVPDQWSMDSWTVWEYQYGHKMQGKLPELAPVGIQDSCGVAVGRWCCTRAAVELTLSTSEMLILARRLYQVMNVRKSTKIVLKI